MRAVWITRSFLDYRIPVYRELSSLLGGNLSLIYNAEVIPDRVRVKATEHFCEKAIGMRGEWRIGRRIYTNLLANSAIRVPWQPHLLHEVRRNRPDVMITDGFFQWTASAIWLRMKGESAHVLCYERTAHTERNAQWYRKYYRQWALRYVDSMCCNGRLCGEYAIKMGMPKERIIYGHMAADTEGLSQQVGQVSQEQINDFRNGLSINGICLIYVGQMIPRKGVRQLLMAWSDIRAPLDSQATLLLVGDGPEKTELEAFCRHRGLKNVRFAGAVDYDKLPLYYASADALVIPTLEDNWSLVVPEAMSCGLPILCSKYNGCWPELVQEGRNGWVFDPLAPADIIRCLKECLASKNKLTSMAMESRIIVQEHSPRHAAIAIFRACQLAVAARCPEKVSSAAYHES